MSDAPTIYGGDYVGPPYAFTSSVKNFRRLPRFGHSNDITDVFSSDPNAQVDYASGLIALFVFLLIIFVLWTMAIITFKVMGQANAGFLSGHPFVIPDPVDDETNIRKRPLRVRIAFLVAAALLMIFAFLLVAMGLTNVNNAATTMGESLKMTDELLKNAELIASNLKEVGDNSISIRDAAVTELDDICPSDPNIADTLGMDIMGIADQAKEDLTMLANFIGAGLEQLNKNLVLVREFTDQAEDATRTIQFWDWEMKLLAAGLFILPSLLATGVGLAMLDLDVRPYQKSLTYFFTPLFAMTIVASIVVCCAMLPISATAADACSGGGDVRGGPDDTVLTVYRNLVGDDTGTIVNDLVGFYTQRCDPTYYPFDFLSEYLNQLDEAVKSTDTAYSAVQDNQGLLEARCGREFDNVITIVEDMNDNLKLLNAQADLSLDLIKCKNVNSLYVNTVHDAGCTYSVDALAWIFASALVISVCGMIMIMLRSAYYPEEYLELGECWMSTKPVPTKSESRDSDEGTYPIAAGGRSRAFSGETGSPARSPSAVQGAVPVVAAAGGLASYHPRPPPPPMDVPRSIKVAPSNDGDEFEVTGIVSDEF